MCDTALNVAAKHVLIICCSCPWQVLNTLKLENEMIGRQAKGAVAQKEKAMVDHDVMKLVRGSMCCTLQLVFRVPGPVI
jgi:hypothetical protein